MLPARVNLSMEDLNCTASFDDLYYLQFHFFQRACAESCRRKFPNIPPGSHSDSATIQEQHAEQIPIVLKEGRVDQQT